MEAYLEVSKVLHKDFKAFALALTQRIKSAAMRMAEMVGRPFRYLNSCNTRKETLARDLIQQDGLKEGLIGIFGCVEPCHTYFMARQPPDQKAGIEAGEGAVSAFLFLPSSS